MILIYHSVNNGGFIPFISVNIKLFEKQMRFLSKNLKVGSIYDYINGKCDIVITFDDGYKDNYTNAYPILKKYGLTATFFLTTGLIGTKKSKWDDKIIYLINKTGKKSIILDKVSYSPENEKEFTKKLIISLNNKTKDYKEHILNQIIEQLGDVEEEIMMSWDNVKEMSENNMHFGSHTVSHPNLAKISSKEAENEIIVSKKAIEEKINKKIDLFSYPYGNVSDIIEDVVELLKKNGFICGLTNGYETNDGFSIARYGPPRNLFLFKIKTKYPHLYHKIRKLAK